MCDWSRQCLLAGLDMRSCANKYVCISSEFILERWLSKPLFQLGFQLWSSLIINSLCVSFTRSFVYSYFLFIGFGLGLRMTFIHSISVVVEVQSTDSSPGEVLFEWMASFVGCCIVPLFAFGILGAPIIEIWDVLYFPGDSSLFSMSTGQWFLESVTVFCIFKEPLRTSLKNYMALFMWTMWPTHCYLNTGLVGLRRGYWC